MALPRILHRLTKCRLLTFTCLELVGCGLALVGCQRSQTPEPTVVAAHPAAIKAAPSADYVGSRVCAECHAEIATSYAATAMGQSSGEPGAVHEIERFGGPPIRTAQGFEYLAERDAAGEILHHERLVEATGEVLYDQVEKIEFVVGSGGRGRSYLVRRGDYLCVSPIGWYSQGDCWGLSPGYEKRNRHFERRAVDGCIRCHVGRVNVTDGRRDDVLASPPFFEASIGCEQCHGPGGAHVAWRRDVSGSARELSATDPMRLPANWSAEAQRSLCYQCHQVDAERVVRYGRSEYDFRPGEDQSSTWLLFSKGEPADAMAPSALGHVTQMESSRCYQASGGQMTCVSCHDPHVRVPAEDLASYYRTRCVACHEGSAKGCAATQQARDLEADSCMACHMPRSKSSDVAHTSQTDHRIPRTRDVIATAAPKERFQYVGSSSSEIPAWELSRARGLLLAGVAAQTRHNDTAKEAVALLKAAVARNRDDLPVWRALGALFVALGAMDDAIDAWLAILKQSPRDEESLKQMGIILHNAGRDAEALVAFSQFSETNVWDRVVLGRQVHALGRLNRVQEAEASAREALRKFPADPQLREWLTQFLRSQGRTEEAAPHARILKQLSRE